MCERIERERREWYERMKSVKSKIKPCFCGTVPSSLIYERMGYYDDRMYFFITCKKCGIIMEGTPHSPYSTSEEKMKFAEELVEKWNAWISKSSQNMQSRNGKRNKGIS